MTSKVNEIGATFSTGDALSSHDGPLKVAESKEVKTKRGLSNRHAQLHAVNLIFEITMNISDTEISVSSIASEPLVKHKKITPHM